MPVVDLSCYIYGWYAPSDRMIFSGRGHVTLRIAGSQVLTKLAHHTHSVALSTWGKPGKDLVDIDR